MYISIVGDSISTFENANPPGYAVYYDPLNQVRLGINNQDDTWWGRVIKESGVHLCINNSYSGSRVTRDFFPNSCSVERTASLHDDNIKPDLILIYMGCNDFYYCELVNHRPDSYDKTKFFHYCYQLMLKRIKANYPDAKIVCGTLMKSFEVGSDWKFSENRDGTNIEEYNDAIRKAVKEEGVYLADLASFSATYETKDRAHPTFSGHALMAELWMKCLKNIFKE